MADFDTALPGIMEWEKKVYTNRPGDRGGPTKFGITQKRLAVWRGVDVTPEDVEALQENEAGDIYHHDWNALRLSEINSQRLAESVFHAQTTEGGPEAVVLLQRAVNMVIPGRVGEDRILGSGTLAAVNSISSDALIEAFKQERIWYVQRVIDAHPDQVVNRDGWLNRIEATT